MTPNPYEVLLFLGHGAGLTYDTEEGAIELAAMLQANPSAAAGYSERCRARAVATFDAEVIAAQWDEPFSKLCCEAGSANQPAAAI